MLRSLMGVLVVRAGASLGGAPASTDRFPIRAHRLREHLDEPTERTPTGDGTATEHAIIGSAAVSATAVKTTVPVELIPS